MRSTPVFVIAEAGVNHDGSVETAKELIEVAARAGADAVKFQTLRASALVRRNAPKAPYQQGTTSRGESQFDMLRRFELGVEQHHELIQHASSFGLRFLSSPFDRASLQMLVSTLNLPIIKLGSGEITNAPLLLEAGRSGRDVILSTGMSTLGEIGTALSVLAFGYVQSGGSPSAEGFAACLDTPEARASLQSRVTLLHCTSEYPAPFEDVNLRCLETLRDAFGLAVGFSDHTLGIAVPIAATALGACAIEKHFTLDRRREGPDHAASVEPDELAAMVRSIRETEMALGSPTKGCVPSEAQNVEVVRRSLVADRPISEGTLLTEKDIGVKRPADGVAPIHYWDYLGRRASRNYAEDEPLDG